MNVEAPDLKQLSAEALRDLLNNLTQAKGFVLEHAPDFCNQMVMWAIAKGSVLVVLAVIFWIVAIIVIRSLWRAEEETAVSACIVGFAIGMPLSLGAMATGADALKAYVAPKVFLVEEITRMIR